MAMETFNFMTKNAVAYTLIDDRIIKCPLNKNLQQLFGTKNCLTEILLVGSVE